MAYIHCPWCARKIHIQPRAYVEGHHGKEQFNIADHISKPGDSKPEIMTVPNPVKKVKPK